MMSNESSGAEDLELLEVLDRYLLGLQNGESVDRERLLKENPSLGSVLDCLDALESVAPSDAEGEEIDDVPSAPSDLPRDFGSFELIEEIGRGGMGVVYRARQKGLDRSVAIKMILASHLASAEHVRRFQVEAKAAAALRHSNIVHIHEVGQFHGQHYFAMEYIEGESLADRIATGTVEIETAVRLVGQVARAVAHLHRQGIVHRDLKPSNILIDREGQPFVTDFGLAKVFSDDSEATATGVIAGTPSYMSPEQAGGRRDEVGPLSDVYSLGSILYELLTGKAAFREDRPLDTLMRVLAGEPTPPRHHNRRIPRSLELICLKCLEKSPEDRYDSAEALAEELDHFLQGETLEVRPPSPVRKLFSWSRRKPALASRLGVLAIFLIVDLVNYSVGVVDSSFHYWMVALIAVWAIGSIGLQQCLNSKRWSIPARFLWGTLDSVLLLGVLLIANGAASALVVCYPLLVVGSGLWWRVRFVWYMTALSLVSYIVLIFDFYFCRTYLREQFPTSFDRHIIFGVSLIVMAGVVSYLVLRVRTLSHFYGQKL